MQTWFSGDYREMTKDFTISADASSSESFVFTPKRLSPAARFIKEVNVAFGRRSGYIESISIHERGGNRTTIRFSGISLNKTIPAEIWNAAKPR